MMSENEKHEKNLAPYGRHDEEVNGYDVFDMVLEEGPPRCGRWFAPAGHVLLNG